VKENSNKKSQPVVVFIDTYPGVILFFWRRENSTGTCNKQKHMKKALQTEKWRALITKEEKKHN
jgi:hypothetical protein